MKLFSHPASSLIVSTLISIFFSSTLFAQERELKLTSCGDDPTKIIHIETLNQKKIFSSTSDPSLLIKVKSNDQNISVTVNEKLKKSRISDDLITLTRMGIGFFNDSLILTKSRNINKNCVQYKQSYVRTNVTLNIIDETNTTNSYHFFVGEKDHYYLSADMLISSIKELYYDEENKIFREREKPASIYFGFNYKIGDLSTQYPIKEFYNNLSLKAIAKISKKPSESMGIGLGYHLNENIELFIARVWTKDNNNVHHEKLGYTPTTTYGISFNLSKALGWLKEE